MATINDYFEIIGGESLASITADSYIREVGYEFNEVLKTLGLKESWDSEWYYCYQCRGIVCQPDLGRYNDASIMSVEPVDPSEIPEDEYYGDFREVYERFQPRMKAMYDWVERADIHLNEAPDCYRYYEGLGMCWDFAKKRDRKINDRRDSMIAEYTCLVDKLCKEIAAKYEEILTDVCDYAYSDESAQEWLANAC